MKLPFKIPQIFTPTFTIGLVAIVVTGAYIAVVSHNSKKTVATAITSPTASPEASSDPADYYKDFVTLAAQPPASTITPQDNVIWSKAVKVESLSIFSKGTVGFVGEEKDSFLVGSYKNLPLYRIDYVDGPSTSHVFAYKNTDGHFSIVASTYGLITDGMKASDWATVEAFMKYQEKSQKDLYPDKAFDTNLLPVAGVDFDTSLKLTALDVPDTFTFGGVSYVGGYDGYNSFTSVDTNVESKPVIKTVGQTKWGTLQSIMQHIAGSDDKFGTSEYTQYFLSRADGVMLNYALNVRTNTLKDDGTILGTKLDGSAFTDNYRFDGVRGCGYPTAIEMITPAEAAGWVKVGTTSGGADILQPKDMLTSTYVKRQYNDYNVGTNADGTEATKMPMSEFITKFPVLAIKNATGRYTIFNNTVYGINAECGKPVVYLYPTTDQQVQVSVDATFKNFLPIPNNGATGWNVFAHTNGQLDIGGASFPYLYWSGYGSGIYREPTTGTVVKTSDAAAVMHEQLLAQGLTEKETADFMEFWVRQLPKTQYTRISWLSKADLDMLAPMHITPRPDTVIRTFLDMEGLNSPVSMPAPVFTKVVHKGFTAVEWGGLLVK